MDTHPLNETLHQFAVGRLRPEEMASVAVHVARCGPCRTQTERAEDRDSDAAAHAPADATYGAVFQRAARSARDRSARLDREVRRSARDLDDVLARPREEWNRLVRSCRRLQSYAFARHALASCRDGWTDDPYLSGDLAELALFVAERLPDAEYGRRNLSDLRADAWASLGNCRRIQSDLGGFPPAFEAALEHNRHGNGAPEDRASLTEFKISYLTSARRLEEALDLTGEVQLYADELRDRHLAGRTQWRVARIQHDRGSFGESLEAHRRAMDLLDPYREPTAPARVGLGLAACLAATGDPIDGLETLHTLTVSEASRIGRLDRVRIGWTESLIHWRIGDLPRARAGLETCRSEFTRLAIPYDTALVELDLSRLALATGAADRARGLAGSAFPVFARHGVEAQTVEALDVFRRAGGLT